LNRWGDWFEKTRLSGLFKTLNRTSGSGFDIDSISFRPSHYGFADIK
jgi:hypothetical protein